MTNTNRKLKLALEFAGLGWPVFPVKEDKTPAIRNWEKAATTDKAQIEKWFNDRNCNFGFPPGRANIAVIDLDCHDPQKNGEKSLRELLNKHNGTLEATYTVRTPSGGLHLYFRAENLRSKNNYLPGVDIKSGGGYVVMPGSVTEKGEYTVKCDLPVKDLPDWFKEAYGHQKEADDAEMETGVTYNVKITPDTEDSIERATHVIDNWDQAVEGDRNNQLFMLMRDLCRCGVSIEKAIELYRERAISKIGLDADTAEVVNTIKSAYSDMSDFGCESAEGRKAVLALFNDGVTGDFSAGGGKFGSDWTELEERQVPPRRWFIEGWLSADDGYTVLFTGKGGAGKSALVLDLIRSLATGEDWCGMKVLRRARSMYVACEDSEEELVRRIHRRSGKTAVPKGTVRLVSRLGEDNVLCAASKLGGTLKATQFYDDLKEKAREFFGTDGGVLVLDTLADIYAGNENDRTQVSQFVKTYLAQLGQDLGVTIIVLAHPAKSSGTGYSGSTAWEGAFRCRWELNYQKEDRPGLLELVLAKSNSTTPGRKITLSNQNGVFAVADTAKVDNTIRDEIVRLIKEAYEAGEPFGRGKQSGRPIENVEIPDPITGEPVSSEEIKDIVSELLTKRVIELFRTNKARGLRVK